MRGRARDRFTDAEVRTFDDISQSANLELHKRPDISGGLIAIDKGEVRAVVSGFETLGFNRAIQAKRQPGSVFKTPTYLAALQLGWEKSGTAER